MNRCSSTSSMQSQACPGRCFPGITPLNNCPRHHLLMLKNIRDSPVYTCSPSFSMASFQALKSSRDKRHVPLSGHARNVAEVNADRGRQLPTSTSNAANEPPTTTAEAGSDVKDRWSSEPDSTSAVTITDQLEVRTDPKRGRGLFASNPQSSGRSRS